MTSLALPPDPAGDPPARERLLALDVFRGLTIAGMLLVNNPGSWEAIYPPLEHAPWHGWTPTDLIFPFFLFIVGITTHLSLSARRAQGAGERELVRQILRRGLLIVLLGLLLNWFPFFWWGKIQGVPDPTFGQRVLYRLHYLRFAGVLQRIGIAYVCAALLTLRTNWRQQVAIVTGILIAYWLLMTLVPVPGSGTIGYFLLDHPEQTLSAWSDRLILGADHIWRSSKTWDPEGPLSTLPAIGTAMLGILCGQWLAQKQRPLTDRLLGMFAVGSLGMVLGLIWHWAFPINKNLWTSSYVVFTAGMAAVTLAVCIWLVDVQKIRGWSRPFVAFGLNPLVAFVGSGLMARIIDSLWKVTYHGERTSIHQVSYAALFEPWLPPRLASLVWGLLFVMLWWGLAGVLHRRNVIIKV
jgi:predicted acyltransferase